jgi:hypothetical protein
MLFLLDKKMSYVLYKTVAAGQENHYTFGHRRCVVAMTAPPSRPPITYLEELT